MAARYHQSSEMLHDTTAMNLTNDNLWNTSSYDDDMMMTKLSEMVTKWEKKR